MQKTRVLVTNDDGPSSPLFKPFLEAIKELYPKSLHFSIPDTERSWISQAVSFDKEIANKSIEVSSINGLALTATPADCVSIATTTYPNLELCLSGINLGTNAGAAFYQTSGTVAAARQAALFGLNSIALSLYLPQEVFSAWNTKNMFQLESLEKNWVSVAKFCAQLISTLHKEQILAQVDLVSVNLPWELSNSSKILATRLAPVGFRSLFSKTERNTYSLQPDIDRLVKLREVQDTEISVLPTDMEVIQAGDVSITPINLDGSAIDWSKFRDLEKILN